MDFLTSSSNCRVRIRVNLSVLVHEAEQYDNLFTFRTTDEEKDGLDDEKWSFAKRLQSEYLTCSFFTK